MEDETEQLDQYMKELTQGQIMPFQNPVCQQTFESLPRIYGCKKKPKQMGKLEHRLKNLEILQMKNNKLKKNTQKRSTSRYLFAGKVQYRDILHKTRRYLTEHYSPTPSAIPNEHKEEISTSHSLKKKLYLQPILPPTKSFDLDDLESRHKVSKSISRLEDNDNRPKTQLQKFITMNKRAKFNKIPEVKQSMPSLITRNQHLINESKNGSIRSNRGSNTKIIRAVTEQASQKTYEHHIFSPDEQIKQENEEDYDHAHSKMIKKREKRYPNKKIQQPTNNHQKGSKKKFTLSAQFLNGLKNNQTMFKSVRKTHSNKSSRKGSVMSNGYFKVPQSKDYKDFIENYKPQKPDYNLRQMFKSPNFRIIRQEKQVYFGEIDQQNNKNGKGVLISEKQIYEGIFHNDQKVKGYQRNMDGIYIGDFHNGLRHGQGKFKWNNGEQFVGQWENGMKNGFGKWQAPQGHQYKGQWKNNKQNGKGVYKHKVSTYKGQFKDFLKDGWGQQIFINGDKYAGEYKEGKPEGKGTYSWHKGGKYEGSFKAGFRSGYGILKDENDNIYEGYFFEDNKDGKGKQIYSNGDIFQGNFKLGARKDGVLKRPNGEQIEVKDD